jgi:hypothetical protein
MHLAATCTWRHISDRQVCALGAYFLLSSHVLAFLGRVEMPWVAYCLLFFPAGGLGMGTSASHPNLTSILQSPSSPTQPSTTNGLQHAGLPANMSNSELALLGLSNPGLAEHAPLRRGGVVSMSTGNIAELYAQQAKVGCLSLQRRSCWYPEKVCWTPPAAVS